MAKWNVTVLMSTSIELPYAPPGSNVFAYYEDPIRRVLYLEPSTGLKARLIILFVLAIALFAMGVTYSAAQYVIRRRAGKRWWMWKRINRKAGKFLIVNPMAGRELMAYFLAPFTIVQVVLVWKAFITSGVKLSTVMIWSKTGLWPCLFVVVWHGLWANLHVYLQLRDDAWGRLRLLNASVANALFVGGGIVGAIVLIATTTISSTTNTKVSREHSDLVSFVTLAAANWNEGDDVTIDQNVVKVLWSNFNQTLDTHLALSGMFWGVTCIFHIIIFSVNLAAFPLIVSLRKHIRNSLDELQPQTDLIVLVQASRPLTDLHLGLTQTTGDEENNFQELISFGPTSMIDHGLCPGGAPRFLKPPPISSPPTAQTTPNNNHKVPTLAEVKAMANRQSFLLEGAKRLRSMERTAEDLQIQSAAAIMMILCQVGLAIFFAVIYRDITHYKWWISELVIFGPLWAVLIPVLGAFMSGLTANAVQEARAQMIGVGGGRDVGGRIASKADISAIHYTRMGSRPIDGKAWVDSNNEEDALPLGLLPAIVVATSSPRQPSPPLSCGSNSEADGLDAQY